MELISREMAIDHIRVLGGEDRERLIGILNNKDILPTIENRPKGRWETHKRAVLYRGAKEYVAETYYECSNCKEEAEELKIGAWLLSDYCPHCGADMRGEE